MLRFHLGSSEHNVTGQISSYGGPAEDGNEKYKKNNAKDQLEQYYIHFKAYSVKKKNIQITRLYRELDLA